MSLFVINRYEEGDTEQPDTEENHLLALQKRIEERKRQKELAASSSDKTAKISAESDGTEKQTKKKKRRSKKSKEGFELNGTSNDLGDLDPSKNSKNDCEDISQEINHSQCNGLVEGEETEKDDEENKANRKKKKTAKKRLQSEITEDQVTSPTKKKKQKKDVADETKSPDETDDDLEEESHEFTILKTGKQIKGQIVERVLPDWLANPEVISSTSNSGPSFDEVEAKGQLDSKLIEVLKAQGYTRLFPVQARLLTWLLECDALRKKGLWPRDTCVSAPTGSGKTLAYVLPILEILRTRFIRKIRCLIVLPAQELAAQVYNVVQKYAKHATFEHTRLKVGLVSGAASFEKEQEDLVFKDSRGDFTSHVDILVATPRRLIDHVYRTQGFSLSDLQFVVIDEADRETFDWLQELPAPHSKAPPYTLYNALENPIPAQKLLFSATLSQDPEKLSRLGLFLPILYTTAVVKGRDDDVNLDKELSGCQEEKGDVGQFTIPTELTIRAIECAEEYKPLAVYHLLKSINLKEDKTLIFTNSGNTAHRLSLLVKSLFTDKNLTVAELSGQLNSKKRIQEYQKFCRGETRVLICSDVLARGVDIPGIKLVISYDLPKHMRALIHRAGRTGRAGVPGTAVFLLIPRQVPVFKKLHTDAKKVVPDIEEEDFTSLATSLGYDSHVENLKGSLEKERKSIESWQKRKSGKKFDKKK